MFGTDDISCRKQSKSAASGTSGGKVCIRETRPSGFIKMEVLVLVLVVRPPNTLSAASFNTRMEAYGVPSMYYELASLLRSLFLC